jgi:hypothetical protein
MGHSMMNRTTLCADLILYYFKRSKQWGDWVSNEGKKESEMDG